MYIRRLVIHLANALFHRFNRHLTVYRIPRSSASKNKTMLNIGSGDWFCKGWTNLDHPSEWYANAQKKHTFVPYDIRNDLIPFADDSVDVIYCSHVIEHIENIHIQKMFHECFRVLKQGGVMRIACPDAEFLYEISKLDTDYWTCMKAWAKRSCIHQDTVRNVDYLVANIAAPKMLQYKYSTNSDDYMREFETLDMYGFFEFLTHDLTFREDYPGDHINYWTFEKAKKMLMDAGFGTVIRSKHGCSCITEMRNTVLFDVTRPNLSLYVEVIK